MADEFIIEVTGFPAAAALQPSFADQGEEPGWLWGSPPTLDFVRLPLTEGPSDAGAVGFSGGTPPGFDPAKPGRPPTINMPSLQDVVDAMVGTLTDDLEILLR